MARGLVILGASGNAHDILDIVDALNVQGADWSFAGYLDDKHVIGTQLRGGTVLGDLSAAQLFRHHFFVNAIGSERSYQLRPQHVARTGIPPDRFATLIHPLAYVSPQAQLGHGVCVGAGAVVAGNVVVGDDVWLGARSVIGHDSEIGDHCVIAPAAVVSGFVRLRPCCFVGAGAMIRGLVEVGDGALIGMGAVVLNNVDPETTLVGNPARVLAALARRNGRS